MASTKVMVVASGVITATVFALSLFIGEVALRAIHLMRDGIPFFESPSGRIGPIMLDQELGWRATADYKESLTQRTKGGVSYTVHRSQHKYGFRQFGNRGLSLRPHFQPQDARTPDSASATRGSHSRKRGRAACRGRVVAPAAAAHPIGSSGRRGGARRGGRGTSGEGRGPPRRRRVHVLREKRIMERVPIFHATRHLMKVQ